MSDRSPALYLIDLWIAIDKIHRYTKHINSADSLLHDEIRWDATIREFEIIGESIKKLLEYKMLDISYRRIVDFRNQLVHAYFGIDENIVWDIIQTKLSPLQNEIANLATAMYRHDGTTSISDAIASAYHDKNTSNAVRQALDNLHTRLIESSKEQHA